MKACITLTLIAGAMLLAAASATAEPVRQNVIWARSTNGAPLTLDGVLNEPAWAAAETKIIRFGRGIDNGAPGSGYKFEGGVVPKDSTYAVFKFLTVGNQLWMGVAVNDSSVGGSKDFNRFDGLLMSLKDHSGTGHPAPPAEYLYTWWYEDTTVVLDESAPGLPPVFGGRWANPPWGSPRSPEQIAAWDAVTIVNGQSNNDAIIDNGYTIEMRFDLGVMGYDVTQAGGDILEWNVSVYDCDWYWPLVGGRFSSNRTWWQCPWGNTMWYDEVRIYCDPTVTTSSGPVPTVGPEVRIPNGAAQTAPVIDGLLNDAVWALAPGIQIKYGDDAVRAGYGDVLKWRAGQYQPPVNGNEGLGDVFDPGDATVKWFFKDQFLYLGFDVNDAFVTNINEVDRWDGFLVSINDKVLRWNDNNLNSRRLAFRVGAGGALVKEDWTDSLITVLGGGALALQLKPNTTVDTLGLDFDEGYTAEFKIDLTKFHYPANLGDGALWIGIDYFDGDCFTPFTSSYGTRTWWGREYENQCCPASAYLDPDLAVGATAVWDGPGRGDTRFTLIGNFPNPFEKTTTVRFTMAVPSRVRVEVFDLQGRLVSGRSLGLLQPGTQSTALDTHGLKTGIYAYRLVMEDPDSGAEQAELSGKLMLMR